ncbi:MAG: hypothetical protein VB068_00705, partial [Petrimonas sp.]|nr:hypothetical protein [Petrimonas sp.]
GAVETSWALDRAMRNSVGGDNSVYDVRGLLLLEKRCILRWMRPVVKEPLFFLREIWHFVLGTK